MAKTKTFGVRLTPDQIVEVERLKDLFAFESYGEMMESWIQLLQNIDEGVCQLKKHPRQWSAQEVQEQLGLLDRPGSLSPGQVDLLILRRLKARFGEDGAQWIQDLLQRSKVKRNGEA